jgi:hypothetical protein
LRHLNPYRERILRIDISGPFSFAVNGTSEIKMFPANNSIPFITAIVYGTNNFGDASGINIFIEEKEGAWLLRASGVNTTIFVEARCAVFIR